MKDTLKVAGRIGAELGAAKAEVERLSHKLERARDHLTHARHDVEIRANAGNDAARLVLKGIDQWLSDYDQSPTDTFTAVEMATAAAQGFRDGQAAVEPAAAQDERKTFEVEIPDISAIYDGRSFIPYRSLEAGERLMTVAQHLRIEKQLRAALTRPAQTEQQPVAGGWQSVAWKALDRILHASEWVRDAAHYQEVTQGLANAALVAYRNALIAQTAPQGKFRMGDLVKKSTGSEWVGRVVGWYSTNQTPEGYAVESEAHAGSVQIYPDKALEAVK